MTLFYEGIAAPHFISIGISKDLIGYLFGGQALLFTLVSPVVNLLAKRYPVRYITQLSFFLGASAIFMLGPSRLIELP
jgi:hypothetical protein